MKQPLMSIIAAAWIGIVGMGVAPSFANATTEITDIDTSKSSSNIVQIAVSDPDLTTLVATLKDTGLVKTLESPGPFTVFAPTNEAFAKLPGGLLEYLLANPSILKSVLLYHVASGSGPLTSAPLETVLGEKVFPSFALSTSGVSIWVNNSRVTVRAIKASNGVIYIIDSVLLPQFL
jgi:uncharacterized surface protein with fasciclin (FAS1) repeats